MMYYCDECHSMFSDDDVVALDEPHAFGDGYANEKRNVSPCCHESYSEAVPCAICGEYDFDRDYSGVCKSCLEEGVRDFFMEYLDGLDLDFKKEFYGITDSYALPVEAALIALKLVYTDALSRYAFHDSMVNEQIRYVMDGDPYHFAEWLVIRKAAQHA